MKKLLLLGPLLIACAAHDSAGENTRLATEPGANPTAAHDAAAPRSEETTMNERLNLTGLTLRFTDASVPPEYHRSYTISAEPGKIDARVDSYGVVIAEHEAELTHSQWAHLTALARQLEPVPDAVAEQEQTGGTRYGLELEFDGETQRVEWTQDVTPHSDAATEFAHEVESLVPNLQALKARPLP
jgi:hypothetical protein